MSRSIEGSQNMCVLRVWRGTDKVWWEFGQDFKQERDMVQSFVGTEKWWCLFSHQTFIECLYMWPFARTNRSV